MVEWRWLWYSSIVECQCGHCHLIVHLFSCAWVGYLLLLYVELPWHYCCHEPKHVLSIRYWVQLLVHGTTLLCQPFAQCSLTGPPTTSSTIQAGTLLNIGLAACKKWSSRSCPFLGKLISSINDCNILSLGFSPTEGRVCHRSLSRLSLRIEDRDQRGRRFGIRQRQRSLVEIWMRRSYWEGTTTLHCWRGGFKWFPLLLAYSTTPNYWM